MNRIHPHRETSGRQRDDVVEDPDVAHRAGNRPGVIPERNSRVRGPNHCVVADVPIRFTFVGDED